ncbi:MAG: hypothetical protein M3082_16965 [Candidatus Dormibacteraeota bacterium]|nr:hypothetical protein [Candidatus Dormibacteraeota bacterium]
MDATTVVIVGVVVFMVVVLLVALARAFRRAPRPVLRPLAPEAMARYGANWDRIESHFVDAPEDAVREADALALALLNEREHPLSDDRLPADMRRARRAAAGKEIRGTEGLRRAMLYYRGVIVQMAGKPEVREQAREGRREIAS